MHIMINAIHEKSYKKHKLNCGKCLLECQELHDYAKNKLILAERENFNVIKYLYLLD